MPGTATEQKNAPVAGTGYNPEFDDEFDPQPGAASSKVGTDSPQAPAVPTPAKPSHNPMTLNFARSFGFSQDEIDSLTPEQLDAEVRGAHRVMLQRSQDFRRNERSGEKPPVQSATTQAAPTKPAEAATAEDEDEKLLKELEADYDPRIVGALRKSLQANKASKATIDGLHERVKELTGAEQRRAQTALSQRIDGVFSKMAPHVLAQIGEGDVSTITNGSKQHILRKAIIDAAEADETPGLSFEAKMNNAAASIFGEAPSTPQASASSIADGYQNGSAQVGAANGGSKSPPARAAQARDPKTKRFAEGTQAEREQAWSQAGTAMPTARENPEPPGDTKAMRTARKIMQARGMLSEDDMPADSFPK